MNKQINILDVKIDIVSKQEVLEKIQKLLLSGGRQEQVVTTNPEFIIEAQTNQEFRDVLNNSWLSIADGYGIRLAAKYLELVKEKKSKIVKFLIGMKIAWWGITKNSKKLDVIKEIITGADLIPNILEICIHNKLKVTILVWENGLSKAEEVNIKLKEKYPESNFECHNIQRNGNHVNIQKINEFEPDLLLVNTGAPYQDKIVRDNIQKIPSLKFGIGVGASIDFIIGKMKRAPKTFRGSYEWLFRLIKQPRRWKRIWNASFKFPWIIFKKS
jgi:N-acetylglucosaminyldiphosphoundecaprenol N-acetyl-beta-D-mannosaminyltransferase